MYLHTSVLALRRRGAGSPHDDLCRQTQELWVIGALSRPRRVCDARKQVLLRTDSHAIELFLLLCFSLFALLCLRCGLV